MTGTKKFQYYLIALVLAVSCNALPPTIGVASAIGTIVVNNSPVEGNANLFEGSQIRTGKASSQVFLQNGAALTLGIDSAGTIYRDHLLLQAGATKVDNMNGYSVHADQYRIEEGLKSSQAVVRLNADAVEVAALTGSLNVFDEKGALLTHVGAGTGTAFQSGAGRGAAGRRPTANNNNRIRMHAAAYLLLGATLAGLGLAVSAIVQPGPTSPGT